MTVKNRDRYTCEVLNLNDDSEMLNYLEETKEFADRGDYGTALERHIWFHNHAFERSSAIYGVRISYALSLWLELGRSYRPALDALKGIRDKKTEMIKNGEGDFHVFHDIEKINDHLGDSVETLATFECIHRNNPILAKDIWEIASNLVFEAKRFDLARDYLTEPHRNFALLENIYGVQLRHANKHSDDPSLMEFAKESFIESCLRLIKSLIALEEFDIAAKIKEKALAVLDAAEISAIEISP